MEKIYSVEFMTYTNYSRTHVAKRKPNLKTGVLEHDYLEVGPAPFLLKESDLDKYKEYGDGYRTLTFVGMLGDML